MAILIYQLNSPYKAHWDFLRETTWVNTSDILYKILWWWSYTTTLALYVRKRPTGTSGGDGQRCTTVTHTIYCSHEVCIIHSRSIPRDSHRTRRWPKRICRRLADAYKRHVHHWYINRRLMRLYIHTSPFNYHINWGRHRFKGQDYWPTSALLNILDTWNYSDEDDNL